MPNIHNSPNSGTGRQYVFRPMKCKTFTFQVKTNANVNICLSPTPSETPYQQYEIFIGGWDGRESAIRRNKKDDVHKVKTPGIVNVHQFRGFWISSGNHAIKVGKEGNPTPFLVHNDPAVKMDFSYYGFCTTYGSTGQWIFADDDYGQGIDMGGLGDVLDGIVFPSGPGFKPPHGGLYPQPQPSPPPPYYPPVQPTTPGGLKWVSCQTLSTCPSPVPIVEGTTTAYVALAYHNGGLIPGCLTAPQLNVCHISWGGAVHPKMDFFLLSNTTNVELLWQSASRGTIPVGALQGGYSENGEHLYIGRFIHFMTYIGGKVHPSHSVCYVPVRGREISNSTYQVLCLKTAPLSLLGL